jgi:membrane-bound lytic murein transglycosylase D
LKPEDIEMKRMISLLLLVGFCLVGCATDQPGRREAEGPLIKTNSATSEESIAGQLRSLERSVSLLRSEVRELGDREKRNQGRPLLAVYKLPEAVSICGEKVPLEDRKIWESLDQEFLVTLGSEAQVLLWMKRARRYFPHIEKRLKELFLPDDLKYVTITESSLRPYAVSSSGAAGIWQFIPATGERFGMRGSGGIDERFDFFKATDGALAYLKGLYEEFKSWPLAMAAYNAGENRIRREIVSQRTRDYFYLDLPSETERYVYKITVAKIILSNPERYGFYLDEREFYDPLQIDRVQVELPTPLSIVDMAAGMGLYYKELKEMNPHLSGESVPAGTHFLNLPFGTAERFWTFFNDWNCNCR